MATVVLVVHPRQPQAAAYARKASAWLAERGHTVVMPDDDASALAMAELGVAARELADPEAVKDVALAVALGGDGTVLRAVRLIATRSVPVLGVNLGRLGYLAQVEPDELIPALQRFFAGDYSVEDRMMLAVSIYRGPNPTSADSFLALNEVVVEKPRPGNTVHLTTVIGGRPWTPYVGDGLIVATPTGSTAYSFSARGPIVFPTLRAMLITPVAPHMAFDRSLVVDPGDEIRVEVSDDRPAALTVDGRERGVLRRGDAVVCVAATQAARFVTFGDRDFYGILKSKFKVAD
ncbi:MAG: kinase, partial [Actinomycetota bacterium]|nr:kinase [Actinomycetota bacterium]